MDAKLKGCITYLVSTSVYIISFEQSIWCDVHIIGGSRTPDSNFFAFWRSVVKIISNVKFNVVIHFLWCCSHRQYWTARRMFITHLKVLCCSRHRWHWTARRLFFYLRRTRHFFHLRWTRRFFLRRTRWRHWMLRPKLTWWRFRSKILPSYSSQQQFRSAAPLICFRQGHGLQSIQIDLCWSSDYLRCAANCNSFRLPQIVLLTACSSHWSLMLA